MDDCAVRRFGSTNRMRYMHAVAVFSCCCRFQSYLDHLAMQDNDDDSESEEAERMKLQCKERTVSSCCLLTPPVALTHPSSVHTWASRPMGTSAVYAPSPLSLQKGLWRVFARNVISFRRGIQNAAILKQFQRFLMDEVNRGSHVVLCKFVPCQYSGTSL